MIREFERLTDPEAMKAIFQERLPGLSRDQVRVNACNVLRTRYKTYLDPEAHHRSFLYIHYELEIADAITHRTSRQQLYAQAFLNGRSQTKYRKLKVNGLSQPSYGTALAHWPDLGLIVWAFPNDPELVHLPRAIDGEQIKNHLPYGHLPAGFERPADVLKVEVDVIRYKPEVRCTIRYTLHGASCTEPRTLMLFGKMYDTDRGREVYHQIEQLMVYSSASPNSFFIASPYGYEKAIHMVWQEALPGVPLSNVLSAANADHFLPLVASGLSHLHRCGLDAERVVSNPDLLIGVRESTNELMTALPEFRVRFEQLLNRVERTTSYVDAHPVKLVHGDFHVKQLLLHENRLAIFDFDDLALGDPLRDIAFFLVDLHFREFEPEGVRRMSAIFCQHYELMHGELPADRLRWHVMLQFLSKAHWFYKKKQQSPRLRVYLQRIIGLAERENYP